jgi:hypothetical protein
MARPSQLLTAVLTVIATGTLAATIIPSGEAVPQQYKRGAVAHSAQDFFSRSVPLDWNNTAQIIVSSYQQLNSSSNVHPSSDSFLRGAIDAWAQHQHLIIRPDEIWFTMLVQMNFYMNKHAEEARKVFVHHDGKQEIEIEGVTWEDAVERFQYEIQRRVKTPWLLDWIQPRFTTSTRNDMMTANILIMGLMQHYFTFSASALCGIPSVTMLGELKDWQRLLQKLENFKEFGEQPAQYANILKPIISGFIQAFKEPSSSQAREFWSKIIFMKPKPAGKQCGDNRPPYYISGWITGFQFWKPDGDQLFRKEEIAISNTLDGLYSFTRGLNNFPLAYAKAPIKLRNACGMEECRAMVLAGNLGKLVRPGVPKGYAAAMNAINASMTTLTSGQHGSIEPSSAWMMYGPVAADKVQYPSKAYMDAEMSGIAKIVPLNWNNVTCGFNKMPT